MPPTSDGRAEETSAFLTGTLCPHVDAAERSLYPELERMLQNRHSMAPMRREHAQLRQLVGRLRPPAEQLDPGSIAPGKRLALRRVLFRLYALLKIHLAEEEAYLGIVEHGVSDEVADLLAAALDHPGFQPGLSIPANSRRDPVAPSLYAPGADECAGLTATADPAAAPTDRGRRSPDRTGRRRPVVAGPAASGSPPTTMPPGSRSIEAGRPSAATTAGWSRSCWSCSPVGPAHGYAIIGELAELGITNGSVDIGQVYRTLRDLEGAGQVRPRGRPTVRARPVATTS